MKKTHTEKEVEALQMVFPKSWKAGPRAFKIKTKISCITDDLGSTFAVMSDNGTIVILFVSDVLEVINKATPEADQKKEIIMEYSKWLGEGSCDVYDVDKGIYYAEEFLGIPHKENNK